MEVTGHQHKVEHMLQTCIRVNLTVHQTGTTRSRTWETDMMCTLTHTPAKTPKHQMPALADETTTGPNFSEEHANTGLPV